jgi:hypothetical protein
MPPLNLSHTRDVDIIARQLLLVILLALLNIRHIPILGWCLTLLHLSIDWERLRIHAAPLLLLDDRVLGLMHASASDSGIDESHKLANSHANDGCGHTGNDTDEDGDEDADEGAHEGVQEHVHLMVMAVVAREVVGVFMGAEAVGWDALDMGGEMGTFTLIVTALEFGLGSAMAAFAEGKAVLHAGELVSEDAAPLAQQWGHIGAVLVIITGRVPRVGIGR